MTDPFAVVRRHCLAIDGVTEKLSHSSPSFFAKGTPSKAGPRPAYVGHRGWIGVRLDRDLPEAELLALLTEAHASVRKR